jgi:peptidyl-prolyl cis-trans isomerase B (cyclophilin B)
MKLINVDKWMKVFTLVLFCLFLFVSNSAAQNQSTNPETSNEPQSSKKANARPAAKTSVTSEPFDKATVDSMADKCVKLETEAGVIEIELFAENAPESVRNFLNLATIGAFDTTTFNRVVPGFVIQGGKLSTKDKFTPELEKRSQRTIPDEPNMIKHERGIVSMAKTGERNSATTQFFILLKDAPHLNETFTAFGRVTKGMEVVENINKMRVEGDQPIKPVRISRAVLQPCQV